MLWEEMTRELECLDVNSIYAGNVNLEDIITHCRKLRHVCISLFKMKERNEEISNLLASYGDQLEYCYVENMSESELRTITNACCNAQFSANVNTCDGLYTTMRVLGSQLSKIRIGFYMNDRDSIDYDAFSHAWNECVNIRDLELWGCSVEYARQ